MLSSRGGVAVTRRAHNPKFEGASPSPATVETALATRLSLFVVVVFEFASQIQRAHCQPPLDVRRTYVLNWQRALRDIEERRAYGREWIKRNPEKAREAMRRWRKNHPEEHLAE